MSTSDICAPNSGKSNQQSTPRMKNLERVKSKKNQTRLFLMGQLYPNHLKIKKQSWGFSVLHK